MFQIQSCPGHHNRQNRLDLPAQPVERNLWKLNVIENVELTALAQGAEALCFPLHQFHYLALRAIADLAILFGRGFSLPVLTLVLLEKREVDGSLVEIADQFLVSDFCLKHTLVLRTHFCHEVYQSPKCADDRVTSEHVSKTVNCRKISGICLVCAELVDQESHRLNYLTGQGEENVLHIFLGVSAEVFIAVQMVVLQVAHT